MEGPGVQRKTGANARRGSLVVPSKTRTARSEVSRELRFRVIATALAAPSRRSESPGAGALKSIRSTT